MHGIFARFKIKIEKIKQVGNKIEIFNEISEERIKLGTQVLVSVHEGFACFG